MVVYRTRAASAPVDFPPIFRPRHHCLSTWTDMTANTFAPLTCSNERECSGMLLHFMKVYHGTANMRKLITVGQQFLADVGCASASSTCLACLRFEFPSEINSGTCFFDAVPSLFPSFLFPFFNSSTSTFMHRTESRRRWKAEERNNNNWAFPFRPAQFTWKKQKIRDLFLIFIFPHYGGQFILCFATLWLNRFRSRCQVSCRTFFATTDEDGEGSGSLNPFG